MRKRSGKFLEGGRYCNGEAHESLLQPYFKRHERERGAGSRRCLARGAPVVDERSSDSVFVLLGRVRSL